MNAADKQIADTLAKYGEPFADNIWRVQGNAVIYHKALERIAAQADMRFDQPTVLRAERDEAVILVTGRLGERSEWSIGEAVIGANYMVRGKQAAYPYAMAEKRAKDRVILKLINLHGLVYSEEEADEFKENRPRGSASAPQTDGAGSGDTPGDISNQNQRPAGNKTPAGLPMPPPPSQDDPPPKSSAALKREGVWEAMVEDLNSDLTDCFNVIALERLWNIYCRRARREGWNRTFFEQLIERFDQAKEDIERQEEAA